MVILCPMDQLGCFKASSSLTEAICSLVYPRNGPPEAVRRILWILLPAAPWRLWKMAECSESTGRMDTPFSFAKGIMMWPAVTNVSLFARAMSFPASMAAMVGRMPIIPTTAVTTISADSSVAASIRPSMPLTTLTSRSATAALSSFAFSFSQRQAIFGLNSLICSSSLLTLLPAARAVTSISLL